MLKKLLIVLGAVALCLVAGCAKQNTETTLQPTVASQESVEQSEIPETQATQPVETTEAVNTTEATEAVNATEVTETVTSGGETIAPDLLDTEGGAASGNTPED